MGDVRHRQAWQPVAVWGGGLASPSMEVGHAWQRWQNVIVVGSPHDQKDLSMDWVAPCQPMPGPWNEGHVQTCSTMQEQTECLEGAASPTQYW